MLSTTHVQNAAKQFKKAVIKKNSVQRPIALGATSVSPDGLQAWVVVKFKGDIVDNISVQIAKPLTDPDAQLGVDATILAASDVWLSIGSGGLPAALLAADKRSIQAGGKLAYFIRNVRSLLDITTTFAATLAAACGK